MALVGIDQAYPKDIVTPYGKPSVVGGYVAGRSAVNIWTADEVKAFAKDGVKYFAPIIVPPQTFPWPHTVDVVLRDLAAAARDWGLPPRSPLWLDIEKQSTEAQFGKNIGALIGYHQSVCNEFDFFPGVYGSSNIMSRIPLHVGRWLGEYPYPSLPKNLPTLPFGLNGWQFWGSWNNVADLDVWSEKTPFVDIAKWESTIPKPVPPSPVEEKIDVTLRFGAELFTGTVTKQRSPK